MNRTGEHELSASRSLNKSGAEAGEISIQSAARRAVSMGTGAGRYFRATWGLRLKAVTAGVSCLLVGISVYSLWLMLSGSTEGTPLGVLLPLAIVLAGSLLTVRGYTVSENKLIVHRLGWSNTIGLTGLSSAEHVPGATQGSIRAFGNGGLFSFAGHYCNANLGPYRAYVTDGTKSVVLKFAGHTIVVSPDEPDEFIAAVAPAK